MFLSSIMELMKESLHLGRTFVGQRSLWILLGKLCGANFVHECTLIYGCSSRAATRSWGTSSSQQSDWRTDKPKYGHVPIFGALGKSTAICRNPAGRHQCSSRWIMLLQCHENASLAVSDGNPYCMLILSGPSCHTEKRFFLVEEGG
jgi:hypothetical protein